MMLSATMHSNYPKGGLRHWTFQKTNASNKAFPSLCKASHLNGVCLLVEQTLGCCRRRERDSISAWEFTESWAWGYTNMQQAYQSTVLILKLQVQNPTAKSIMKCNRCLGWHHHLCKVVPLLHTNSPVKCWRVGGVFLAGDERDKVPISKRLTQHS